MGQFEECPLWLILTGLTVWRRISRGDEMRNEGLKPILPDDELMLRLEVRKLHCSSTAMANWLGSLGRLGWLVRPTFCLWAFNKFV
jgi:hypothetical protein